MSVLSLSDEDVEFSFWFALATLFSAIIARGVSILVPTLIVWLLRCCKPLNVSWKYLLMIWYSGMIKGMIELVSRGGCVCSFSTNQPSFSVEIVHCFYYSRDCPHYHYSSGGFHVCLCSLSRDFNRKRRIKARTPSRPLCPSQQMEEVR